MKVRLLLVVSILVLASLACSLPTLSGNSEGKDQSILNSDDFSKESSGWDIASDEYGSTGYVDGTFHVQVLETNTDIWANYGKNYTDAIYEVDATKAGGPDVNDFGILCRYVDNNNYYQFIVASDGYYGIAKVKDGEFSLIGREEMEMHDAIKLGDATNHILVSCVGPTLTLTVNGTVIDTQTDAEFTSGDVGLFAGTFDEIGVEIAFDNFVVRKAE